MYVVSIVYAGQKELFMADLADVEELLDEEPELNEDEIEEDEDDEYEDPEEID